MAIATQLDVGLERLGAQLLEKFPPGIRASLCQTATNTPPFEELWRSGPDKTTRGADGERLLQACSKSQRTVLVFDAEKDSHVRDLQTRTFRSALCTPVLDDTRTPIAFVLLTSDLPEAFASSQKFALERFARDYAALLKAHRKEPVQMEKKSSSYEFLYSPITLVAAFVLLLVLIAWSLAPADAPPVPDPVEIPNSTVGPSEVAEDFLRRLQEGRYEEAWTLFDPTLRQKWPAEDFRLAITAWAQKEKNQEILSARATSRVQRRDQQAQVLLFESNVAGDSGRWNWELKQRNGEWKISELQGPVTAP